MFKVNGQIFIPKVPMEFFPDIDQFSNVEIELLSSLQSKQCQFEQQGELLFKQLIKLNPTYSLYHSKYANIMHSFGNINKEMHHRKLAYQFHKTNTQFVNEYITCLKKQYYHEKLIFVKDEILFLYQQMFKRFDLYQQILDNRNNDASAINATTLNNFSCSEFGFGHLSEFPYLSFLNAVHTYSDFIEFNVISLNGFISDCYDDYCSFQSIWNHRNCHFNTVLKYGELSVTLAPKNWNKLFGLISIYSLKGRYKTSLNHINHMLNVFENGTAAQQNEIIKSLHPMRMSQLYLIYFKVLIRLEQYEIALQNIEYFITKKLIHSLDNVWFQALQIELFASLKSPGYFKKSFQLYHKYKQSARLDNNHRDTFFVNYAFLLSMSGKPQIAMDLLEKRALISIHKGAWIEYLLAKMQHYTFRNYDHAKYHYFASFKHNSQIPEARYYLALLMIELKEYKMSYLQLKKAIDMNSGFPNIELNGSELLKRLRKALKKLKCAHCNRGYYSKKHNKNLSVCKGCGKFYYCNKKCQKRDWNVSHRWQCDKSYIQIYKIFKLNSRAKCKFYAS